MKGELRTAVGQRVKMTLFGGFFGGGGLPALLNRKGGTFIFQPLMIG